MGKAKWVFTRGLGEEVFESSFPHPNGTIPENPKKLLKHFFHRFFVKWQQAIWGDRYFAGERKGCAYPNEATETPGVQKLDASEHPRLSPTTPSLPLARHSSQGPSFLDLLTSVSQLTMGLRFPVSALSSCPMQNIIIQIMCLNVLTYLKKTGKTENQHKRSNLDTKTRRKKGFIPCF